jgi:N-acetylmuramoyl-L-alanine amidase
MVRGRGGISMGAIRFLWRSFVWLVLAAGLAQAATLKAYRFDGGEYVMVSELADFYHLGRDLSPARERADYRAASGQLVLQAECRDITVNEVTHWLGAPVLFERGRLWVAATDVLKTIDPVLREGHQPKPLPVRMVVLDPGHGGTDYGTHGERGIEKTLTLDLARRVKERLEAVGLRVGLTRSADRNVSLDARVEFAGEKHADLFVSLHFNSGGSATGIETYCVPPAGAVATAATFHNWRRSRQEPDEPANRFDDRNVWLAHCVQKTLIHSTGDNDRGVRRARFVVVRDAPCPAILVEGGFLTNDGEESRLLRPEYRDTLAKAIADGILNYKAAVEK